MPLKIIKGWSKAIKSFFVSSYFTLLEAASIDFLHSILKDTEPLSKLIFMFLSLSVINYILNQEAFGFISSVILFLSTNAIKEVETTLHLGSRFKLS